MQMIVGTIAVTRETTRDEAFDGGCLARVIREIMPTQHVSKIAVQVNMTTMNIHVFTVATNVSHQRTGARCVDFNTDPTAGSRSPVRPTGA